MEVIKNKPIVIDPLWKRILFIALFVLAVPASAWVLGFIVGIFKGIFLHGFNVFG